MNRARLYDVHEENRPNEGVAHIIRGCMGKRRYATAPLAVAAIKYMARRLRRDRGGPEGRLQHYRCRFCRDWHIGHSS